VRARDNLESRYSSRLQGEFGRFKITWEAARIKLPTKRDLEKKGAQMTKFINQPMTEVRASFPHECLCA
jgi:hypothetical protein